MRQGPCGSATDEDSMQQQHLSFTGPVHRVEVTTLDRPWAVVTQPVDLKEEPLKHLRQVGPTCAYYALAMLTGTPIDTVLRTGQDVLRESRFRKLNGQHCMLTETYRRLGYRFPYEEISKRKVVRADKASTEEFSGSGLLRVTKTPSSGWGHLTAYKEGIIYDSAMNEALEVKDYLAELKWRGHRYLRVIDRRHIERDGNKLTFREQDSQAELMKQPRRSRRRYAWAF